MNTVFIALSLLVFSDAQISRLYNAPQKGDGTYYDGRGGQGQACSIWPQPSFMRGLPTVAINNPQWAGSATCGMCVQVTGTGQGSGSNPIKGSFIAVVSDRCPECKTGDLDLAKSGDGRWKINWVAVDCPVQGGLQYIFQGSNAWYWKIQVMNHRIPVNAVQFQGKDKVWYNGIRTSDNFWNPPGGFSYPSFPANVRIQGVNNQWVSDVVPRISTSPVSGKGVQFNGIKAARAIAASSNTFLNTASAESSSTTSPAVIAVIVSVVVVFLVLLVVFLFIMRKVRSERGAMRP